MTDLTPYHAKYYVYELTRRHPSSDLNKLTASLQDAQVDLNPHQVEAALFAFQSPLSKGAILADEVGLGKTIEAGIILSQKWAERKRRLLIIAPSNLRKQWSQELADKFFLPSIILETKSFNQCIKEGNLNPFDQEEIIICSFQFARNKESYVRHFLWDLVIIDEAHRLRNVYKPDNKIGNSIKSSLARSQKILLTATPLQNSLLELYGLVSIVDEYIFGDLKSFKSQFSRLTNPQDFQDLKTRLAPICKRTLRRQVIEYINYTNRIALVEEFYPYEEEVKLYEFVSEYLRKDRLFALPTSQRHLMTLILRKLLASSTFAIQGTLEALANKLKYQLQDQDNNIFEETAVNFETYDNLADEWCEDESDVPHQSTPLTPEEKAAILEEREELERFATLAKTIKKNSKGDKLLTALSKGFEKLEQLGAAQKAIIFTESTRTQAYLNNILESQGYEGKTVLFNGSNNDPKSRQIYKEWLHRHADTDRVTGSPTADKRQAIVDHFRHEATILIATEAAAEGINLQFCSLVVNYDLPWNPQRIEQRIGRCHRYGQQFDVVVINFLNKANAADQRVYQLLDEKFKLFSGVFGASDEVLGSIESGVDFEKRIAQIYQECRTPEDIKSAFDQLQLELSPDIEDKMSATCQQLLENFDDEVHQKLRINLENGREYLNKYEQWLWEITKYVLGDSAQFDQSEDHFRLVSNPFDEHSIHAGPYRLLRASEHRRKSEVEIADDTNVYRIGHPLAQRIIKACKKQKTEPRELTFEYSKTPLKISILEPLIGQSGWLRACLVTIKSLDEEEYITFSCLADQENTIDSETGSKLFSIPAIIGEPCQVPGCIRVKLDQIDKDQISIIQEDNTTRNASYFDLEYGKLDNWADDMKLSLEKEIKDLDAEIKLRKAEAKKMIDLKKKVNEQRLIKDLEKKRNDRRRHLFEAQDEIEQKKDTLLNEIEQRLQQMVWKEELFTIKWRLT